MFSNMLSEIRAYGEGCVVVDQVPTRLIPDAVKNTNLKIIHRLTAADAWVKIDEVPKETAADTLIKGKKVKKKW